MIFTRFRLSPVSGAVALLAGVTPVWAETSDVQRQLDAQKQQIASLIAAIKSQKTEIDELKSRVGEQSVSGHEKPHRVATRSNEGLRTQPVAGAYSAPLPVDDKKLHLGGITITPGGYVAAEGMFRSKTTQSDINTSFMAIPLGNSLLSKTNELRVTNRQSKATALIEGDISPTMSASGYYEMDFQGATGNGNGSNNSYAVRVRHLYATLDSADTGFHVLAGQDWSLITPNSKGITPRNEYIPPTIESNFVPGFMSQRTPQIRITKDFDKTLWFALSAEAPQTTFQNGCNPIVNNVGGAVTPASIPGTGVANVLCQSVGTGASFGGTGDTTPYSLNHAPDMIAKVAYEGRLGDHDTHFEAMGLYRNFYDAVEYTPTNTADKTSNGFAVGGGAIVSVIPQRLEASFTGITGRGIGRYSTAGFGDATLYPDGAIRPLWQTSLLAGSIFHATPQIDLYLYGGLERQQAGYASNGVAATPTNGLGYIGVGAPNANDTGCDTIGGTCAGNTHTVYQITGGLWDRFYQGRFGYIRLGLQYSYTKRILFGSTDGPGGASITPSADDHMIFTSFRYYPF